MSPTNIQDETEPVFVDRSGRRRRLLATAGTGVGATMVVALGVVVAGLFGASPAHIPGLPGGRHAEPASTREGTAGLEGRPEGASRATDRPTATASPTPTVTPVAATTPTKGPSATPSKRHEPTQTPSKPGKPR